MNSNGATLGCLATCFVIAGLAAILVAAALFVGAGWLLIQGVFIGLLVATVISIILILAFCRPLPRTDAAAANRAGMAPTVGIATKSAPAPKAAAPKAAAPAPKPEPEPEPAPAPKPTPEPAKAAAPAPAPAESTETGSRPEALDGPRGDKADDLKKIKGIGPKLEKLCNSLGFYHFDQIAAWTDDEVAWVDDNLEGFKGRVSRDTWVEQAKLLAGGGETAFSKKVDGGDVY